MTWTIVSEKDVSMGKEMGYAEPIVRIVYNVRLDEPENKESLLDTARAIVFGITEKQRANCIGIFCWLPDQEIGCEVAYASIDWAPNGKWEDGDTMVPGDYSHHEYVVNYIKGDSNE